MSESDFEIINLPPNYIPENIDIQLEKIIVPKTIYQRSSTNPAPKGFHYLKHVTVIGHCNSNTNANEAVKDAFNLLNTECKGDDDDFFAFDVKTTMQISFQGYHVILTASIYQFAL